MPLDTIPMQNMIPEHLDFDVRFEPTKVDDKKYVINAKTDEYLGVVGDTFKCANHTNFFKVYMIQLQKTKVHQNVRT